MAYLSDSTIRKCDFGHKKAFGMVMSLITLMVN